MHGTKIKQRASPFWMRDEHEKRSPFLFFTPEKYTSVILFNDGFDHCQTQSGSGRFRCEVGNENPLSVFIRNANPVIGNANEESLFAGS